MNMPNKEDLDNHLQTVIELVSFLLESGLKLSDLGVTYSTLMGYYSQDLSDINITVYGKDNFWKLMRFLENCTHPKLRWKSYEEWEDFYKKRSRQTVHEKSLYLKKMNRRKSEGFFNNKLFVIFAVEKPNETWFKWGEEKYKRLGSAKFEAVVKENKDSVVRPGMYEIYDTKFIGGDSVCKDLKIDKVVFHSRDYCMLAYPGEKVEISGIVEEVTPTSGRKYYRLVIYYFDAYISDRREKEYFKLI
jgi:hypothetical protein